VVGSVSGFPVSYPYTLVIDHGESSREVVNVTAGVGTTLTVTRGQDSTSASGHTAGAAVVHAVVARDLAEPQAHIDASTNVHGLAGGASVVGTTSSQTLTNKTLTSPTISNPTLTGTVNVPDNGFTIQDNGDATKQLRFEASGITTATTRTVTVPNANGTLVLTDNAQTLSNKNYTAEAAAGTDVVSVKVTGDSNPRFVVNANGIVEWGGGSGAVDCAVERAAAGVLVTDSALFSFRPSGEVCFGAADDADSDASMQVYANGQIEWGDGGGTMDTTLYRDAADVLATDDHFTLTTAGRGIRIKEGSNARMGVSTLVAGTVTVSNTSVTANTRIFLTCQSPGGTPGFLRVSARTASTSFTILSSSGTDTSSVGWLLIEPA
jgi:hypothetical protein